MLTENPQNIASSENGSDDDMERSGLEPLTSTMPLLRSTSWANAPNEKIYNIKEDVNFFPKLK